MSIGKNWCIETPMESAIVYLILPGSTRFFSLACSGTTVFLSRKNAVPVAANEFDVVTKSSTPKSNSAFKVNVTNCEVFLKVRVREIDPALDGAISQAEIFGDSSEAELKRFNNNRV